MLTFTVYDKAFASKGRLGGVITAGLTARHLAVGSGLFTVRRDNPRWGDLMQPGARVVAKWDGSVVMTGRAAAKAGQSGDGSSLWAFDVVDDFAEVSSLLGWPVPGSPLSSQASAYDTRNAVEETVLKGIVSANATRLGVPLTTASDLGRGTTVRTSHRFHPILDRFPVRTASLGVTVRQSGAGWVMDVYEPVVRSQVLKAPVVRSWSVDYREPTVTRVVAGNQGDGAARVFRSLTDSAREAAWGLRREVFLDARDTDNTTETDQRMAEIIAEGAPTAAARVVLAEANHFRFGQTYQLGDTVSVLLDTDLPVLTDTIREVKYEVGPDMAPTVTPILGDLVIPEAVIPRALAAMKRRVDNLSRS